MEEGTRRDWTRHADRDRGRGHWQARNLTRDEFAMNHPAGRIGRRLMLRVADVMVRGSDMPTVAPDTLIVDALPELTAKALGCVLVVDAEGALLGTFTDGDLRRSLQQLGAQVQLRL